jgi:hypothetical protein
MINREEILQVSSGREIDILVAEHVLGRQVETDSYSLNRLADFFPSTKNSRWWRKPDGGGYDSPPPFSSASTAAWQVVEHLNTRGQALAMRNGLEENKVAFDHPGEIHSDYLTAKTVAGAICKAALLAIL